VEFKYLVVVLLVLIVISLGKALYHLSSSTPGDSGKMVGALAWRIGLSVLLFVLLIFGYTQGWVTPPHGLQVAHGSPVGGQSQ
jgi:TRAP-type C4-dicarboxylate transport system permease large subunit